MKRIVAMFVAVFSILAVGGSALAGTQQPVISSTQGAGGPCMQFYVGRNAQPVLCLPLFFV